MERAKNLGLGAANKASGYEARRHSEELYRGIFENCVEGIFQTSCDGRYLAANPALARMLGYDSPEELMACVSDVSTLYVDPGGREEFAREVGEHGALTEYDYQVYRKDGSAIWVSEKVRALRDPAGSVVGFEGTTLDITERKRAEQEVRDSEARYRLLFESNPHPMWIFDVETLSFVAVNDAAVENYGYSRDEFLAMTIKDIHAPEDVRTLLDHVSNTQTYDHEKIWRHRKKDGAVIDVEIASHAITFAGEPARLVLANDVTKRVLAEGQLLEAQGKYRSLVEQISAITYTWTWRGDEYIVSFVSPQIQDILGYTRAEWNANPTAWYDWVHPEDRAAVIAENKRCEGTAESYSMEYRMVRKDGRLIWVRDAWVVVEGEGDGHGSFQGLVFDVTEQKLADELLREAEERFRAIVEHVPAAIYLDMPDDSVRTVYVSPQIDAIMGVTAEDWIENPQLWANLLHPADRAWVVPQYLEAIGERRPWSAEYRVIRPDGREVWVHDETTFLHDQEGNPTLLQGVMFDVTEQKLAEQALRDSEQREREAAERLRALDEMKNTFLAAVSHELRSPLTSILGVSLTLERHDALPDEDRSDLLDRLVANARKLDRLLKDLLDIDRLQRGIVEPQRRITDVGALARRTVESLDSLADRSVEVHTEQVVVSVDPAKVERIIENLLVNAARHTGMGNQIWLRVEPKDGGVLIVVEDDGPGVPTDLRGAIFEPFRQGPTASKSSPGTGIGLSLIARFAELHGGRAWVEERDGGGGSFHVFLPSGPVPDEGSGNGADAG